MTKLFKNNYFALHFLGLFGIIIAPFLDGSCVRQLIAEGSGKTRNEEIETETDEVKGLQLFKSGNYDKFSFLPGNRLGKMGGMIGVDWHFSSQKHSFDTRVHELTKSMEKTGYSILHPLHIAIIDGIWYILDGQGRYAAAKEENVDYYYVFVPGVDTILKAQDYVYNINTSAYSFSAIDKLLMIMQKESTSEMVKKALTDALKQTRDRTGNNPKKHTSGAFMNTLLFSYGQGCHKNHKLIEESFGYPRPTAKDALKIQKLFNDFLTEEKLTNFSEQSCFCTAISVLVNHDNFYSMNCMSKFEKGDSENGEKYKIVIKSNSKKDYLTQFENIINRGLKGTNRIILNK